MKKLLCILLLGVLAFSCDTSSTDIHPYQKVKNEESVVTSETITVGLMTSSASIEPSQDVILKGINFSIVVNESRDTTHWSTSDLKFKTPEGYYVGAEWDEIPMNLRNSLSKMPGWGYYIKLNSDWQLGFCEGESCTNREPGEGSTVKWIFKRKS